MPGNVSEFIKSGPKIQAGPGAYSVSFSPLSRGVAGTRETLAQMARAVRGEVGPDFSGYQDEAVRRVALAITSTVKGHDSRGEINALFRFTRDKIKYVRDPVNLERVQDAMRTLQIGSGDCDDKAVFLSTLLASLGYASRFVVQSQDAIDFDHVYLEVLDEGGEWIPLDPTADCQGGVPCGFPGWRQSAPVEWVYEIFPTGEDAMFNTAQLYGLGQTPYDDDWWERYIYDTSQRIIDVIGAAKTDAPYVSENDPRYRPNVIYAPPGAASTTRAPAPGTSASKTSSGFSLGQGGVQINYFTAAAILAGVLIFMQGRRGR